METMTLDERKMRLRTKAYDIANRLFMEDKIDTQTYRTICNLAHDFCFKEVVRIFESIRLEHEGE